SCRCDVAEVKIRTWIWVLPELCACTERAATKAGDLTMREAEQGAVPGRAKSPSDPTSLASQKPRSSPVRVDNSLPLRSQPATSPRMCRCLFLRPSRSRQQSRAARRSARTLQTTRNRDCRNLRQSDIRHDSLDCQNRLRPAASKGAFPYSNSKRAQRTDRTP